MKITQLSISNVKRISAIDINADGKAVLLTGDNAQGKSSVLDSILLALTNKGLDDPIRHGAERAEVRLSMGDGKPDFIVRRVITGSTSRLEVKDANGKPVASAQTFLDGLISGGLALDPLGFVKLKDPRKQAEQLRDVLGLREQFAQIDAIRQQAYDNRTEANREAARHKALIGTQVIEPGIPEETSAAELIEQRKAMQERTQAAECAAAVLERARNEFRAIKADIARLEAELEHAKARREELKAEGIKATADEAAARSNAPTPEEVAALDEAIRNVDANNAKARRQNELRNAKLRMDEHTAQSAAFTARIADLDAQKAKLVASAKLPVEGLAINDDGVTVNGVPLAQMSTAEQIRISCLIAMSGNPTLKILIIREGALVNRANRQIVYNMAEANGFQIWEERFHEEPGAEGLFIVDGSISNA